MIEKLKIRLWSRNQTTSTELRSYFCDKFRIDVGMHSYGCFDQWRMPGPMKIGRFCSIARTVRYTPINHPYHALTTNPLSYERRFGVVDEDLTSDDCLVIEDDVWIGHHAIILPSCKFIGRGAVIGAGSIVTKDVAPYSIVVGNPARKLKDRFPPDVIDQIEASQWWTLSIPELRALAEFDPTLLLRPTRESLRRWNERERKVAPTFARTHLRQAQA
ncbi:CatB-related O-acetyltransferase [Erythrobacter sp. 3-20A1M]|uniref:CatB-related O-acetyltransferase n=1 Tax=Erythrobacter sp. 3-20A1M TaxID=2653850 RepID=UPI0035301FB2